MSSNNIGIFYTVTSKSQYQQLSKPINKPVHPYIMKIMENTASPVITKEIQMLSMINSKSNMIKKQLQATKNVNGMSPAPGQGQKNKNVLFSSPAPTQNYNVFSMNFSQLSTGKPCGSCGGR